VYGDWGPSAFDVRRNFVANVTYEVPAGSTSGIARAILSNWQVSAILALQDGTPFSALTGFSQSRDLARSVADRPSLAPGARDNPVLGGADHYFDTSAFLLQAPEMPTRSRPE
jgi:hypothetical protein